MHLFLYLTPCTVFYHVHLVSVSESFADELCTIMLCHFEQSVSSCTVSNNTLVLQRYLICFGFHFSDP